MMQKAHPPKCFSVPRRWPRPATVTCGQAEVTHHRTHLPRVCVPAGPAGRHPPAPGTPALGPWPPLCEEALYDGPEAEAAALAEPGQPVPGVGRENEPPGNHCSIPAQTTGL